ncbi:butyrate kinase [Streptococcus urinalis FB127-CNA-2]|uniref:Probable butyrate kinase n=1 Tax=Streptococcus urinalis 2285-97 TaxID=764291 RepID=G5KDG6_9STRE|nr:butyrate kinase [Streptococcus urinalis]EHJ57073.1 butyrate kinase [Streptococcus urinalis 2285-97]EKS17420.1 butyrate kinase [Streptococcus urinalis FB127-CNA-2]VEF32757.1 acetate kinase [Streptococcus urinalis]
MTTILAINPGATSTKLALYKDEKCVWKDEIIYDSQDLDSFPHVFDQFDIRLKDIEDLLLRHHVSTIDLAVGRGGLIGPVKSGAILANDALINHLQYHPVLEHPSNLGAKLAKALMSKYGNQKAAYVYDPVTVDSMRAVSRITGLKNVERTSTGHHLNMRAVARKAAEELGKPYDNVNLVIAHVGGGSSASAHEKGHIVDFVSDDEIMFSAERSGGMPIKAMVKVIKEIGLDDFSVLVRKKAGLQSLCQTADLREVEAKIAAGDKDAALVFDALALGIAKTLATLAVSVNGPIDMVCLTGGMAYSEALCQKVAERTAFIGPFKAFPGEFELEALALGGLRVYNKTESYQVLEFEHEN